MNINKIIRRSSIGISAAAVLLVNIPMAGASAIDAAHGSPDNVYLGGYILGAHQSNNCPTLRFLLHNKGKRDVKVVLSVNLVTRTRQIVEQETIGPVTVPPSVNGSGVWVNNHCSRTLANGSYGYTIDLFNTGGHHLLNLYGIITPFTVNI